MQSSETAEDPTEQQDEHDSLLAASSELGDEEGDGALVESLESLAINGDGAEQGEEGGNGTSTDGMADAEEEDLSGDAESSLASKPGAHHASAEENLGNNELIKESSNGIQTAELQAENTSTAGEKRRI